MRKALLLYNPLSGGRRERRLSDVEIAAAVLRQGGVDVAIAPTEGPREAAEQARQAQAFDTIFACGGDGTVHDLLQGIVGTSTCLGIIPLGTGNTLAHDLGLPMNPAGAARLALSAHVRRIAVGHVQYQDFSGGTCSRYFTVTVGIGVDAQLFYRSNAIAKHRLGMTSYYAKATWLWLTHSLDYFEAQLSSKNGVEQARVSQLLAVRIGNFGGVLRELAPEASLDRNDLRLVLFRTRSRLAYLGHIVRGMVGARWQVTGIELKDAERAMVSAGSSTQRVFVEADGELLGTLSAEISIVPNVLNLLVP